MGAGAVKVRIVALQRSATADHAFNVPREVLALVVVGDNFESHTRIWHPRDKSLDAQSVHGVTVEHAARPAFARDFIEATIHND